MYVTRYRSECIIPTVDREPRKCILTYMTAGEGVRGKYRGDSTSFHSDSSAYCNCSLVFIMIISFFSSVNVCGLKCLNKMFSEIKLCEIIRLFPGLYNYMFTLPLHIMRTFPRRLGIFTTVIVQLIQS